MSYQNILVVKLSAIGDVIHALPVAHALKEAFPQARITWVVEKPAYDLVANHPYIDEVILFEKARCRSLADLRRYLPEFTRQLKTHHFDLALDLQGLFKSAIIAFLSGAPKRMVYCNSRELSDLLSQRVCGPHQQGHIVEQYLDVVRALTDTIGTVDFGIRCSPSEGDAAQKVLHQSGWQGEPYVVMVPGANWLNKRWPTGHFGKLIDLLRNQGIYTVIPGGKSDLDLVQQIHAETSTPFFDLIGKTSLKELAWIIKNARVTIGGDTGPMHLAAALGTPTLGIMGPTNPERNGPYGPGNQALVTPRPCAGCWRRKCEKQLDCLAAVSIENVYQAAMQLFLASEE